LFLPCKQQADATTIFETVNVYKLFLPCKQQADATKLVSDVPNKLLFLPCKQQADATHNNEVSHNGSCFYLANSRQMQQDLATPFLWQSCFYLANSRQMQRT